MTLEQFTNRYQYDPTNDLLGEGGFGRVYRAYDNHCHEYVAIKIQAVDPKHPHLRLRNEVLKVQQYTHKNIARYKEWYTFCDYRGETDVAVMKYYNNGSLDKLMANNTLSVQTRYNLLVEILEGIAFLHSKGIIHRDLKPQNILIVKHNNKYTPLITDFGISKQLADNAKSEVSNSLILGTPAYSSPEQLTEDKIYRNTDLWSFGIIAYQMLIGECPFNCGPYSPSSEEGRAERMRQIKKDILPNAFNNIQEPWQSIIRQCLIADNKQRINSAIDCLEILGIKIDPASFNSDNIQNSTSEIEIAPCENTIPLQSTPRDNTKTKRQWWIWILLLCTAIISACILLIIPNNTKSKTPKPQPTLTLDSSSSISLPSDDSNGCIYYTITNPAKNASISASSNMPWLSLTILDQTINYHATPNNSMNSRSAEVTISYIDQEFIVRFTQDAKRYKIGDYYNENNKYGIVIDVMDGGTHGLILYPYEIWGNFFDACDYATSVGENWELPSPSVYEQIYNNLDVINRALTKINRSSISKGEYWSYIAESSQTGEAGYIFNMSNKDLYVNNIFDTSLWYGVRLVSRF